MHWLTGWARRAWAITLGLIPLLLAMFQQISLVSPFSNAIAIPLVSLVVVRLTLLATLPPIDVMLLPAHWVLSGLHADDAVDERGSAGRLESACASGLGSSRWNGRCLLDAVAGQLGLRFALGVFPLAGWVGQRLLPSFWRRPKTGVRGIMGDRIGCGSGIRRYWPARRSIRCSTIPARLQPRPTAGTARLFLFSAGKVIKHPDAMVVTHADSVSQRRRVVRRSASLPVERLGSPLSDDHPIHQAAPKGASVSSRRILAMGWRSV